MSYVGKGFVIDGYVSSTFGGYINITPDSGYFPNAFVVKVDSTNTTTGGTSSNQMGFYFEGAYDVTIYDDEGNSYSRSGTSAREDITFSTSGEHTCQIVDNGSSGFWLTPGDFTIATAEVRDCNKYIEIIQWGAENLDGQATCARCSNLVSVSATDEPGWTSVSSLTRLFSFCSSLVTLQTSGWNVGSTPNSLTQMFRGANSLVQTTPVAISGGSGITNYTQFGFDAPEGAAQFYFADAPAAVTALISTLPDTNTNLSGTGLVDWLVNTATYGSITNMSGLIPAGTSIDTADYDKLLIACDAGGVSNIILGGGASTYTSAGAGGTARANLVSKGWTITDGGGV